MAYQTQPGTLPHRVVQYLKGKPEGYEASTAELSTAVSLEDHQVGSLTAWLKPARDAGVLRAELRRPQFGRPLLYWSLGDGTPLLPAEEDPAPPQRKVVPAVARAERPFRAAFWTDGSLILCGLKLDGEGNAVLPASDTAKLRQLLAWSPL